VTQAAIPPDLPINEALAALLAVLGDGPNAVLVATPGAGKTTSVPLALLDAPWVGGRKIIMLAPRRLAARAAANRMARLLSETVGETVGYRVRLDNKVSDKTCIEVVTEGIFIRMILGDPELTGIAAVIFDEVHERNLDGDLALALALDAQSGLRNDLRLLAMSATLDGARMATMMGDAPVIESAGRMFPVITHFVGATPQIPLEIQAANVAVSALGEGPGDALVFLPGVGEINRALTHLQNKSLPHVCIVTLHGGLEPREQDQALAPPPQGFRKIVLSTSIAETSLTIPGVQIVVDCGQSRRAAYEPDSGLTRLVTVRASRASADQRRGRAGRTAPGLCYRLWEAAQAGAFPAFDRPEILEADLAPMALTLAAWGVNDPAALRWLDPPPVPAWHEATALLTDLGALDVSGRITPHGHALAAFGLPPRLAHMIVEAGTRGFGTTAAWVAALLSERGLGGMGIDLSDRLDGLKRDNAPRGTKARGQAQGWARQIGATEPMNSADAGKALALAFPERIAKGRDRRGGFVLRNGRGGEVALEHGLASAPFLAVGALQGRAANARITECASLSRVDIEDLFGDHITKETVTTFDKVTGSVRGRLQTRLGALVLEEATAKLSADQIARGLMRGVQTHGLNVLTWTPRALLLRARLAWLHANNPADWAPVDDVTLFDRKSDWLEPALLGIKSLSELDMAQALMSQLDWAMTQRLAAQAPERFETPAGTSHPIDYAPDQGPTVEVRVQEVFGLTTHPMLAGGHVALVFQLLSPAHRPVAVTANLPQFWHGAWGDVRKDMKARYPRHVWPDDPSSAAPTTRVKPRGT
jgi:ATP-dependent helicase HrpB